MLGAESNFCFRSIPMRAQASRFSGQRILTAVVMVSALALGACQNRDAKLENDPISTGSVAKASAATGSFKTTTELSKRWQADQTNVPLGLDYAENLGKIGQSDEQIGVLKILASAHPQDVALQSKIGKQLLIAGRAGEAIEMLERAASQPSAEWKTLSALGSAYDQQGNHEQARINYKRALALQPNELSVENNLAMSFALEGKLPEAEKILRSAVTQPGIDKQPRVRQNLALVVGLQGRFDEAKQIAGQDLPPDQVEANLAYLQEILAQPNTWQQLQGKTPG
jgi:Flp pilus assembly protein TadD